MKKIPPLIILAILCAFFSYPSLAQDKIYSLTLKEHEIEEAIRKSLATFLDPKDYVVKVRLKGTKKVDAVKTGLGGAKQAAGETLPGFELEEEAVMPNVSDLIGNAYWKIDRMQIDLIMHKEIMPSVNTFIRETVPVVSEMDPARGDVFNFIPILPESAEEANQKQAMEEGHALPEKRYFGFTFQELIYTGLFVLLLMVIIYLIFRATRLKKNLIALEDALEHEEQYHSLEADQTDPFELLKKEKEERLRKQENLLSSAIAQENNENLVEEIITQLLGRTDWAEQIFKEFNQDKKGVEKFVTFLSLLGLNTARKLFLDIAGKGKYIELEQMAGEVEADPKKEKEVLREIRQFLLTKRIASPEMISSDPFQFMKDLSNGQIALLIKDEPVKIKAIVLSQLNSVDTAEIITKLKKDERGKTIVQLGNINELPLDLIEKVAHNLATKARALPDAASVGFDGIDLVVNVISDANAGIRKDIINNIRTSDRKLSDKVESKLFLFESIPVVPKDALTNVVRSLASDDVIIAISGCSKELQEKVIMCFPEKIRRTLVSSLKAQHPDEKDIRAKRKLIVQAMQKMAENKKVDLKKIQSDWEKASNRKPAAKSA